MSDRRKILRSEFSDRRRQLDEQTRQAANQSIATHLENWAPLQAARVVAAYAASKAEADVSAVISHLWQQSVQVALPVVAGNGQMAFYAYTASSPVQVNRFGITEPRNTAAIRPADIDVVLAPLLAYDSWGNRLGMGGGYYDRYLPNTRAYILGVAFACQFSAAELPHEAWDVRCHAVVTENGVLEFAL
ncbi:MAG: 5-formyltetrahydrofolate cyclo-ligase [bacterium]